MADPLRHEALPYRGHDDFVASSVSVLRDGLDRDERPMFLASQAKIADVRDALGSDVEDVVLVATDEHGRNPSRIMTMLDNFRSTGDGRRALGVNETVLPGLAPPALQEAQLAESLLNSPTLTAWAMSIICLYGVDALNDDCGREMRRAHPVIRGESSENADYRPDRFADLYALEVPPPPEDGVQLRVAGPTLGEMRALVQAEAARYGLREDRADDLVLAVNEIVTNSVRHGGGRCVLTMWFDRGAAMCDVRDRGYIRDPLVGRLAPSPDVASGRGLWLANHLCDLLQIRSSPAGTVVRLTVDK